MAISSESTAPTIGLLVRTWRAARGINQLDLALQANVSARHLSFIETGRSNPSREMVVALAEALEVPLRDRNAWLRAAGYAALYRETPLDAPSMDEVRAALSYILGAHGPNPAFVMNQRFDIVSSNDAAQSLVAFFAPAWRGPENFLRMLLSPDGLKESVEDWAEVAGRCIRCVKRALSQSRQDASDDALLDEALAAERDLGRRIPAKTEGLGLVLPIRFRRAGVELELFTAVTKLGVPLDVTLQELRIETFFPVTAAARAALHSILHAPKDDSSGGKTIK